MNELRPEVGAELTTRGRTITETDLVSFSSLTGDWHPQHGDAEWAANGRFGERVAHGMLVLSYALGLMPFDPERVVALRGLDSVSFKRPVRIGDTIRLRSTVERVRELDAEHSLVTLGWRVINQEGRTVVRARVEALWRSAEAPPAELNGDAEDQIVDRERVLL
jgi:acyl dehydratase